jgi:hypothetical protein
MISFLHASVMRAAIYYNPRSWSELARCPSTDSQSVAMTYIAPPTAGHKLLSVIRFEKSAHDSTVFKSLIGRLRTS